MEHKILFFKLICRYFLKMQIQVLSRKCWVDIHNSKNPPYLLDTEHSQLKAWAKDTFFFFFFLLFFPFFSVLSIPKTKFLVFFLFQLNCESMVLFSTPGVSQQWNYFSPISFKPNERSLVLLIPVNMKFSHILCKLCLALNCV